jgi:hypothetical protein
VRARSQSPDAHPGDGRVGVIGAIIAFWVIGGVLSFVFVIVKIAVILALIAGAFWLVSRFRR